MKILGTEIIVRRARQAKPKDVQLAARTSNVMQYPVTTQNQGFTAYLNVKGQQKLSFDLIDGLYDKTIMNRIINKIAGDCTRMNYSVSVVDMDGQPSDELRDLALQVDVKITRSVLRNVFRDMLKYGTSFLYIKYGTGGVPELMYTIDPRYLTPIIDSKGTLTAWQYIAQGSPVNLKPEELLFFPNDPATGEVFGKSLFGPIIQILELLLNSQLNNAILIDRYAIPIIQWMLDSGIDGVRTEPKEILDFMTLMYDQLAVGNDVGTDAGVKTKVIGTDANLIDFIPIVQDQKETLGITCGVPLQLMGMKGDNLSVTTRQMQSYLEFVRDIQEMVADRLIELLYKPFFEKNGKLQLQDYRYLQINFPMQAVEESSKAITWIAPAINLGLITRDEGRNTLGFKGEAIEIEAMEIPSVQPEVTRPGATGPQDPNKEPEPNPTGDPAQRKHE